MAKKKVQTIVCTFFVFNGKLHATGYENRVSTDDHNLASSAAMRDSIGG